eukprot:TRINITY_DN11411_c1_g3_i1.p1 TRINITY_DN11411_c1_g3~~TRINITY_DN11411_c1_g3_i1.p1  ORF type:complete len:183 (-),score=16.66 TRINITY_DN11411_c1_g3_i1:246-794(-)
METNESLCHALCFSPEFWKCALNKLITPEIQGQKSRLNSLLAVHAGIAFFCGSVAIVMPHFFGWFFGEEWHSTLVWRLEHEHQQVHHVIIRLFGALIFTQGVIVWNVRNCQDGVLRQGIVKAYFIAFSIMALVLLYAHLTAKYWRASNWVNISLFTGLSAFYGWFSFMQPPPVFEGLDRMSQ